MGYSAWSDFLTVSKQLFIQTNYLEELYTKAYLHLQNLSPFKGRNFFKVKNNYFMFEKGSSWFCFGQEILVDKQNLYL